MITCNRCGKENQDHYKFCLGCGNDIRNVARVEPPRPEPPIEPPAVVAHVERPVDPPPPAALAPAPKKGGIPWGDSPKMPAPLDMAKAAEQLGKPVAWGADMPSAPVTPPPAVAAVADMVTPPPVVTPPPTVTPPPAVTPAPTIATPAPAVADPVAAELPIQSFGANSGLTVAPQVARLPGLPVSGAIETPARITNGAAAAMHPVAPVRAPQLDPVLPTVGTGPHPMVGHTSAPMPTSAPVMHTPMPVAVPPMAPSNLPDTCPACGKAIIPGFAFCGVCGTRLTIAPASASPGKTMYMAAPQPAAAMQAQWHLVVIRPDGSEGGSLTLRAGANQVGRGQGPLFDADLYLSPRHAEFVITPDGLLVRDTNSLNGVFVKISHPEPLMPGDVFRIGQELIRFDVIAPPGPLEDGTEVAGTPNPGYWGRLTVVIGRDLDGAAFPLLSEATTVGRERGDVLFPDDGYVSGTHARVSIHEGQVELTDLGSSNGTFLRIRGERTLPSGTFVLMGQQLFRIECR